MGGQGTLKEIIKKALGELISECVDEIADLARESLDPPKDISYDEKIELMNRFLKINEKLNAAEKLNKKYEDG